MPYPKWRRRHSSRARVILRPGRPHEPNDRGPLPVPLRSLPLASARTGGGLAGPEFPALATPGSAALLPAGLRVEPQARRARDLAPRGAARDREAADRQALARFRRDERARD